MNQNDAQFLRESYRDAVLLDGDGKAIAKGDTTLFFRARRGIFRSNSDNPDDADGIYARVRKMRLPGGNDVELIRRNVAPTSKKTLEFDFFYRNGD